LDSWLNPLLGVVWSTCMETGKKVCDMAYCCLVS